MNAKYQHILFADDDLDDVQLLQEAFKKTCPEVNFIVADNGALLLDILKTNPAPDFIILDINMPTLNGKECLKEIKREHLLKRIPVMMYSTSGNANDIKESFSNGADYYVIKPNSINDIEKLAEDICKGTIKSSIKRN